MTDTMTGSLPVHENDYNGWRNRSTWNVALWIQNDEPLYRDACRYMERRRELGRKISGSYLGFIQAQGLRRERTPDGIKWMSTCLDYAELDAMMGELL